MLTGHAKAWNAWKQNKPWEHFALRESTGIGVLTTWIGGRERTDWFRETRRNEWRTCPCAPWREDARWRLDAASCDNREELAIADPREMTPTPRGIGVRSGGWMPPCATRIIRIKVEYHGALVSREAECATAAGCRFAGSDASWRRSVRRRLEAASRERRTLRACAKCYRASDAASRRKVFTPYKKGVILLSGAAYRGVTSGAEGVTRVSPPTAVINRHLTVNARVL